MRMTLAPDGVAILVGSPAEAPRVVSVMSSIRAARSASEFLEGSREAGMSHWFEYFPGRHMWSQGMMFGIEMQTWGAAALGEIDQIGQKLKARVAHGCLHEETRKLHATSAGDLFS